MRVNISTMTNNEADSRISEAESNAVYERVMTDVNKNGLTLKQALEKEALAYEESSKPKPPKDVIDAKIVETAFKENKSVVIPEGKIVTIEAVSDITGHFDIGKVELINPLEATYLGSGRAHPPNRTPAVNGVFSIELERFSDFIGNSLLEIFLENYTSDTEFTEEYPELVNTVHLIALLSHYPDIQNPRGPRFG